MSTLGLSKVFILDKYFNELQKFWETERKLQDACSSNEALYLQQRLRSLSSELVTLRNRLHVTDAVPHVEAEFSKPTFGMIRPSAWADVHDLIHLPGPLTEDAVLRTLHTRFYNKEYFTNVGPVLLTINSYNDVGNSLTLSSASSRCPQLLYVVHEAIRQQSETGYPQAIILGGESGSGKTYSSMVLLRQFFDVAGGGPETDTYKHMAAAITVLRSLGSAKTTANSESSRFGHFIEIQVTDGAIYRTKMHCYFLDQARVVRPLPNEKNYHIFYQMLAGLTKEERVKLSLEGNSIQNLQYLNCGDTNQDEIEDSSRFDAWKTCLSVLGIPFMDVVRVLASVLLLGNIQFVDGPGEEANIKSGTEIKSVSSLLGISSIALFRGLTSRTTNVRGQIVNSVSNATMATVTRDALAKALYCRTVATIVRRANSLKRLGSSSGTLSTGSSESVRNRAESGSSHPSSIVDSENKASKSLTVLSSAVHRATDGFIGILDMFGFEDGKPSQLEHLCINLCAETMQHFYNTHVFKSSIEYCREEGVYSDVEVDYVDNVPCIDLISSLKTGLLSALDIECLSSRTPESYIQRIKNQHTANSRLIFDSDIADHKSFGVQHFAGNVFYHTTHFLESNKDVVSDDIISVFHKSTCSFGFAIHLFGIELKALYSKGTVPRGTSFRISPTSHTGVQNGNEPVSTLTQDFHTRLDNLLRTLVHAKPHFIRCIKSNSYEEQPHFDRREVIRQIRALQVVETVHLMAGGYPHRMRFKAFAARYRILASSKQLKRTEDKAVEDCKIILDCFIRVLKTSKLTTASTSWSLGKRYIFLSEGARQELDRLRAERRHNAAVLVQSTWRDWKLRKGWLTLQHNPRPRATKPFPYSLPPAIRNTSRPCSQPVAGTPPTDVDQDNKAVKHLFTFIGQDLEHPPPVPPSRPYTVTGSTRIGYPQSRVIRVNFPDGSGEVQIVKGETVVVLGASERRGHLVVEHKNYKIHVPYQYLELKTTANT
ncbi:unconventional myosin-Va-like isoform X2 [Tachypleus tridentatus]|uniref:unconventional myosin-Va-like isoform X2 n=1 Tax=Tachypleus tridentatus TaxID=6853 RepID=UPI003FD22A6F